ncbi:MAG: rod shape-determining protein MreC [Flavobacteriaceae bacterium]|nr:rod shape-determining protein MreC [Flavobacteriaceae bacterium]
MQQIINFFIHNKNFLLFLFLFAISLGLTLQSHSYHKSKFVNSANSITGYIYSIKSDITTYFGLRKENELLLEENSRLKNLLQHTEKEGIAISDTAIFELGFVYRPAEVINNNFSKANNFLTLKGGKNQGVKPEMGVITSNGIVGITDQVGANYSTVLSILNSNSSISVQLKRTGHFGSLVWNGKDPNILQLIDISRQSPVAIGDSITTDGRSTIFPKNIPVGIVKDFTYDQSENFYIIDIALFNDMTRTENVYIIENKNAEEIKELENRSINE